MLNTFMLRPIQTNLLNLSRAFLW